MRALLEVHVGRGLRCEFPDDLCVVRQGGPRDYRMRSTVADLRLKAYGVAAGVFALDRLSKWIVESNISSMDTVRVIPGLFNIVRSENRGMAFGIMNDS